MNKRIRKIICILVVLVLTAIHVNTEVSAAGGLSIWSSASQVSEGGVFSVTVKAASNYFVSNLKLNVSGGSVVSGLTASSLDRGESASAKIKITGDTCTVSVTGVGANYDTETEGAASASVSVKKKVVVVDNRSKDNTLASLSVSDGTLSPAFSSGTTEYNVEVGGTIDKITVQAQANDTKATVTGTGEKQLVPGNNQFTIVCTAENGSTRQYTVYVHVDETPLVYTEYNNQKLGLVRNQNDIGIPASFEATTKLLDGQEVQAYHSNQFNMSLLYLVDEEGNKNFYIYDEEKGIHSVFRPVSILGRNVILFDLTEEEQIRENMIYGEVAIDGTTLYGWTYENSEFSDFVQFMAMNEFGEKVIYQYEKTENSLQLYREYEEIEEAEKIIEPEESEKSIWEEYSLHIIVGLGLLIVILLIALICVSASRSKSTSREEILEAMSVSSSEPVKKHPSRKHRGRRRKKRKQSI